MEDQEDETPFAPRCMKGLAEVGIFCERSDLFTGLDLVYFDTTSLCFEGEWGEWLSQMTITKILTGIVPLDSGQHVNKIR